MTAYPLLEQLTQKSLVDYTVDELCALATDIRHFMIDHQASFYFLGSSLGVVDLIVAIHHVFSPNEDEIYYDVGHQTVCDLILRHFCHHAHHPFDFTQHPLYRRPGQGISQAIGAAIDRSLTVKQHEILSIIGDQALLCGQAFEALNHLGGLPSKLIVVLNDNLNLNEETHTGMEAYLAQLIQRKNIFEQHSLFECLGFNYLGPLDGHDMRTLVHTLQILKQSKEQTPVLLHVKTKKGKGYRPAEADEDGLNATCQPPLQDPKTLPVDQTLFDYAMQILLDEALRDPRIIIISLKTPFHFSFQKKMKDALKDRFLDVSISEAYAVKLSESLSQHGYKPCLLFYSIFSHRLFDPVVVESCLHHTALRFMVIENASLFGVYPPPSFLIDCNLLPTLPNITLNIPTQMNDLKPMVKKMFEDSSNDLKKTMILRLSSDCPALPGESSHYVVENHTRVILTFGLYVRGAKIAAELLTYNGHPCSVIDLKHLEPLDEAFILKLAQTHQHFYVIEDQKNGGLSTRLRSLFAHHQLTTFGHHVYSFAPYEETHAFKQVEDPIARSIHDFVSDRISMNADFFVSVA